MQKYKQYIYTLELPRVPHINKYVEISHIDPLEHPILYLYEYIEKTGQYRITHKVPYVALLKCGGYTEAYKPLDVIKDNMPDTCLFLIPWCRVQKYSIGTEYSRETCVTLQIIAKDQQMCQTVIYMLQIVQQYGNAGVMKLLAHNDCKLERVQQTREDFDCFTRSYTTLDVPAEWYSMDALEVPFNSDLPIYPGGIVHISYMDVIQWILFQCEKNAINLHTEYINGTIVDPLLDEFNEKLTVKKRQRSGGACPTVQYDIEDLDVLMSQMAPCVTNLIGGGRQFPKNEERKRLMPILKQGGVPLDTTAALLNKLHNIDPNNNARTGVDRGNPAYWYEKEGDKVIHASGCAKMGTCPFKNTVDPKAQCSKEFKVRFPDKVQEKFRGPADWFHWINK